MVRLYSCNVNIGHMYLQICSYGTTALRTKHSLYTYVCTGCTVCLYAMSGARMYLYRSLVAMVVNKAVQGDVWY